MPNSDRENAIQCAERIRRRLAERAIDDDLGRVYNQHWCRGAGARRRRPATCWRAPINACIARRRTARMSCALIRRAATVTIAKPMAADDARMDSTGGGDRGSPRASCLPSPDMHRSPRCDTCWWLTRSRIAQRSASRRSRRSCRVSQGARWSTGHGHHRPVRRAGAARRRSIASGQRRLRAGRTSPRPARRPERGGRVGGVA